MKNYLVTVEGMTNALTRNGCAQRFIQHVK
jgi:hypothetical protein